MSDDAPSIVTAAPDPAPRLPAPLPDPGLPPGTVNVVLEVSPGIVKALRKVRFLAAGPASPDHIAAAVFAMLAEALQAGVRAPETSSPSPAEASSPAPPAEDAEAARRRTFLEKLAKVQA